MNRLLSTLLARKALARPRRPLGVEALGDRTLLAGGITASLDLTDHILRVTGTDQADAIRVVNDGGQVRVEGVIITVHDNTGDHPAASVPAADVSYARADGLDGDDRIEMVLMDSTPVVLEALGGSGRDTLVGGPAADLLTGGADNDLLIGGAGNDQLDGGGQSDILIQGTAIDVTPLQAATVQVDYMSYDPTKPFGVDLTAGDHFVYAQGVVTWFAVGADGTVRYDPALEGVVTGQGTSALSLNGTPVHLDATAIPAAGLMVDYVSETPQSAVDMNLMPGSHFVYTQGVVTWFTVGADGKIDYDAALDGVLSGRGTNALTLRGAAVHIDATAIPAAGLMLDYVSQDPQSAFDFRLMPGDHFVYTQGNVTWFKVGADGKIDYDPVLEGVLSGRGTNALALHGTPVHIDATAIPAAGLMVDYVSETPQSAVDMRLMPGSHFVYTQGIVTWFTVGADGKIDYDAALDGVLSGRGTNALTLRGASVHIDTTAIPAIGLMVDYVSETPQSAVDMNLMPGSHFVYTQGIVTWFTVGTDGTISYDPTQEGVVTGQGTHSLTLRGVQVHIDATAIPAIGLMVDYVSQTPQTAFDFRVMPGSHFVYTQGAVMWFTVGADGKVGYDVALEGILTGQGTSSLMLRGRTVSINPGALTDTALSYDYLSIQSPDPFQVNLLLGQHFIYTSGGRVLWFTVGTNGITSADPALAGVVSDATATLEPFGVLHIRGTAGADTIRVVQQGDVLKIDGMSIATPGGAGMTNQQTVPTSSVTLVYVESFDGNDTVTLDTSAGTGWKAPLKAVGGDGNDTLTGGDSGDTLIGGNGSDLISGGLGNDTLIGCHDGYGVETGGADDTIWGGAGNDSLYGGDGRDFMVGEDGNDFLKGDDGNDTLIGCQNGWAGEVGGANDTVLGGAGDDSLYGGDGNDDLHGDAGRDFLKGDGGSDLMDGGNDSDFDRYQDDFSLGLPFYMGQRAEDIDQQASDTCQTLATLAAASDAGYNFSKQLTKLANNQWRVRLYPLGVATDYTVTFDGTWTDTDPAPAKDAAGRQLPEFWTILFQRARLMTFGLNTNDEWSSAMWTNLNATFNQRPQNSTDAIRTLTNKTAAFTAIANVTFKMLSDSLQRHAIMTAFTPKSAAAGSPVAGGHVYAIRDVYVDVTTNTRMIKLYNPWGFEQTITYAQFTTYFQGTEIA